MCGALQSKMVGGTGLEGSLLKIKLRTPLLLQK